VIMASRDPVNCPRPTCFSELIASPSFFLSAPEIAPLAVWALCRYRLAEPLCRCPDYADVGLQAFVSGGNRCEGVGIILGADGW
jgi:hypothetical protein